MFAHSRQHAAQIDDVFTIQFEFGDGGASHRRQSDQFGEIVVPGEMLVPAVAPWMKERDFAQGRRVNAGGLDVFDVVATDAGEGEIAFIAQAAGFLGNDVIVGERV